MIVKKTLNQENEVQKLPLLDSPSSIKGGTAFPTASPSASTCLSTGSVTNSPGSMNGSPITVSESASIKGSGDITVGSSSKNFPTSTSSVPNFKVGDRVLVDFPGSKRHGKIAEIVRLKTWEGYEKADVRLPDEKRLWEVLVSWIRPIPLEDEQKNLFEEK